MKRILIVLFVCSGLIAGCNSNNKGYGAYGGKKKKGGYTSSHKPPKNKRMSSSENADIDSVNIASINKASELDSLLPNSQENTYVKPKVNYSGATGMGMGGSYASSSYRHDEMNHKKYEKKALAKQKEREALMKQRMKASQAVRSSDSLNTQLSDSLSTTSADSSQYLMRSY